jgi:hypothetical protein
VPVDVDRRRQRDVGRHRMDIVAGVVVPMGVGGAAMAMHMRVPEHDRDAARGRVERIAFPRVRMTMGMAGASPWSCG